LEKKGAELCEKNLLPIVKHGDDLIIVWPCVASENIKEYVKTLNTDRGIPSTTK